MLKSPCFFIALETFWPSQNTYRLPVHLPPVLHRLVADHRALGYGIIPIGSASFFNVATDRERITLQTDVEVAFAMRGRVPMRSVLILEHPHDPRELWDTARCFDIDLRESLLMTANGQHVGMSRAAGLRQVVSEADLSRTLAFA